MAKYNFKKQAKVYLVTRDTTPLQYALEVGLDISISQAFTDSTKPVKTLHSPTNFFERSVIKKAQPASFEFEIPFFKEGNLRVVNDLAISCNLFDLYISTEQDVFKLEKAVITNGTYVIERLTPLRLTVAGEASKLSKVGTAASYTIPGTPQSMTLNRTHLLTREIEVKLDTSVDISSEVYSLTADLQNNIKWNPYETVQAAMSASSAASAMYPNNFVISDKTFAGSIGRYLCDTNNSDVQTFNGSIPLRIKAGETIGGTFYGIDLNMPTVSFTNRLTVEEVFRQNYDWKLTSNQSLNGIINYINLT